MEILPMDSAEERELLLGLAKDNIELQRLLNRHEDYEQKIRFIRKRGFLTSFEQQEVQNLKLKKLRGKERLFKLFNILKDQKNQPKSTALTKNYYNQERQAVANI